MLSSLKKLRVLTPLLRGWGAALTTCSKEAHLSSGTRKSFLSQMSGKNILSPI